MRFAATLLTGALLVSVAIGAARAREPSVPTAAAPSLAEAFAAIHAHPKVDLTHSFGPRTPVWPGFGQAKMTPAVDPQTLEAYTIAKDGFRATYYAMVGQYGTHIDPPAHADPTGATMDEIPLDQMMLPIVVLDDTPFLASDPAHMFSVADLDAWEKVHGRVPRGTFVALRTDLSKAWTTDPERFRRGPLPGWSAAVLAVLIEQRGAMAIGDEALDTDAGGSTNSTSYVLKTGHYRIEAMANLDKVPATGAFVVATWPKPERGLGFPARVFAVLP